LIDDLLAYVQAASQFDLPSEIVSLEPALAEALMNLRAAIAETGARITHDAMQELRMAPVHAQQVFQNLIGNSLKYHSAAPPTVHVGALKQGDAVMFSIQDNGIGIAEEHLEQVFELCKRLHTSSEYQGTGIGLAICKKLVERYGGRIWVESEPDKGATFFFTIPC
jgi:light-regulated signal transduction histidine kinase (bacteriophytochrome)